MRALATVLWHFPFFGFLTAIYTMIAGAMFVATGVGAPLGTGLFELGKFLFAPFGHRMVNASLLNTELSRNKAWRVWGWILMVIWLPFGLLAAFFLIIQTVLCCLTIIGIPAGVAAARSIGPMLNPVGKKVITADLYNEIMRRKASERADSVLGTHAPTAKIGVIGNEVKPMLSTAPDGPVVAEPKPASIGVVGASSMPEIPPSSSAGELAQMVKAKMLSLPRGAVTIGLSAAALVVVGGAALAILNVINSARGSEEASVLEKGAGASSIPAAAEPDAAELAGVDRKVWVYPTEPATDIRNLEKDAWIFNPIPDHFLAPGDTFEKFKFDPTGVVYFGNRGLFARSLLGGLRPSDFQVHIYLSPDRRSAFTVLRDGDKGGVATALVNLATGTSSVQMTMTKGGLLYAAYDGVAWSQDGEALIFERRESAYSSVAVLMEKPTERQRTIALEDADLLAERGASWGPKVSKIRWRGRNEIVVPFNVVRCGKFEVQSGECSDPRAAESAEQIATVSFFRGTADLRATDTYEPTAPAPTSSNIPRAMSPTAASVEPFSPAGLITVVGSGVRIRAQPFSNDETEILGVATQGSALNVIGRSRQSDGVWYYIRMPDGRLAFVRSDLTSAKEE